MYFLLTCGEGKLCQNVKKPVYILSKPFSYYSLKMHKKYKNDQLLVEKSKPSS